MSSAFEFAKYLLEHSSKNKSSSVVSLYNAFRSLNHKDRPLTEEDIKAVFKQILLFPHWRTKLPEISNYFERYFNSFSKQEGIQVHVPKLEDIQLIKINKDINLEAFLKNYYQCLFPESRVHCSSFGKAAKVVVVLHPNKALDVYQCSDEISMIEGELSPLMDQFVLHYTPELRLDKDRRHRLLMKPFRQVQLAFQMDRWQVQETQGYSMKILLPKEISSIEELPDLFYHIKSMESRFIHKSSDPLYLSLTRDLESCIEKLAENPDIYKEKAVQTYQKARNAFENIFSDDRLLHLLLKELAMMIASDRAKTWDEPEKESREEWLKVQKEKPLDSTNLLPIVE